MAQLRFRAGHARRGPKAQLDQSLHGTREESIRNLRANLAQAEAQYRNAQNDYNPQPERGRQGLYLEVGLDASRRARDTAFQQVQAGQGHPGRRYQRRPAIELRQQYAAALRAAEENLLQIQAQSDDLQVKARWTAKG